MAVSKNLAMVGAKERNPVIDALRGYAVLAVILVHTGGSFSNMTTATAWGARGVQLFFVVSAFTIAMMWGKRNDGALAFYIRRFFRIAPMFWLAIPFYLTLYALELSRFSPPNIEPWHVALTAAFLHGLHPETINSVVPGDWSIANEMLFYAMFPAIAVFSRTILAAAALVVLSIWIAHLSDHNANLVSRLFSDQSPRAIQEFMFLWLPSQFVCFTAGILAFACTRAASAWRINNIIYQAILLIGISCLAWLCYSGYTDATLFALTFASVTFSMAMGAGRYLTSDLLARIGQYSFSIYLLHFAIVPFGSKAALALGLSGIGAVCIAFFVTLAISTLIASFTYRFIELPMIGMGNKLAEKSMAGTVNAPKAS